MIYLELFISYLKIGFFGFGGGYSMLSLIQHEVVISHGWISSAALSDIIAISQMTPGPIAINSATYIGYTVAGFWGSVIATTAVSLPSLTLMIIVTRFFLRLKESKYMEYVMTAMRPSVIAMIAIAAVQLLFPEDEGGASMIDAWSWVIFAVAFVASLRRFSPIKLIVLSAVAGISIYYLPVALASETEAEPTEQSQNGFLNQFDVTSTEVIASSEFEQKWVDYLFKLQSYNPKYAAKLIKECFEATTTNPDATTALFDLTERYLYNGNSPIPNEELFIPVLEFMISEPTVDELLKLRPTSLLELVMKNRKGAIANDFTISGKQTMHQIEAPYTMLYFYDPDCVDCKRVKEVMKGSELLKALEKDSEVKILRVSIIENKEVDALYDIKATPTIYLLDQEKHVILKDEPIETILDFLHRQYTR